MIKLARTHGACSRVGREYLFSEDDLLNLWEAIREPAKAAKNRASAAPPLFDAYNRVLEHVRWHGSLPPTKADRREVEILEWLSKQSEPKGFKQIPRAGAKTIAHMLHVGFVSNCGQDEEGSIKVKLASAGRDELKIVERWKRLNSQRRQ